ncbi:PREDICTED: probable WRKY transcription factor 16 isoform X2 [Camelina sativa]|uniref:Probable WRKY transcription factor 16 isoform X2 n=1 Tax=Camelina sativa TaxID=90675 RepID=A0ABM0Y2S0_CAMSA|nr:PREDICTED: probable WRKY transcription factor 16 isoform X2 [Camelina sativa]
MADSEQLVYISCAEEIRYSFVSHLSEALRRKGIHDVFVDSYDDLLSDESQSKVERARVSVMVLPGDRSTACLDKLVKVLECERTNDQVVVPVLYGVRTLETDWHIALDSKGFSSIHQSRKGCSDSQLVKDIVRDVYEKLFYTGRIGIYSKLLEIETMVCKQSLDIRRVGIWGMPGIGKTTLAKAVFDQMSSAFDASCFIEDYTKAIQEKGLYRLLEEQFLEEKAGASGGTITKLSLIKEKLNNKRVLVVLDDVRNALVVESFLRGFDWFGPESLIIITSRDRKVFRLCRVNQIYEVPGLNEKEALQLFSFCASMNDRAEQGLHEVSMKVIAYAKGHPLALNIYGKELKGIKSPSELETAFLELKERPPTKFVDAIKSCYDSLNDSEKYIFLDIACFFQGENVDYVMQLLEGCGFFPHVGMDVLVDKCLVTLSENRVCMHNLIQDVGREIIKRETLQIERRSRLWEPWCIKLLLEDNRRKENGEHKTTLECAQGTDEIEGMFLDTSNLSFDVNPAAFENMLNLRLLKIYCSKPEIHPVINFHRGSLQFFPNELRLLHWENYPLQLLPQNFDPRHLVEINMPYSQLRKLWGGIKKLEMLRTIRLCHSQQLVDIDDLLKAPNLEVIDLQGCTKLHSFPATGQLMNLRVVNLSGCTEIKSFPEIPPNIEILHLRGTGITELPLCVVKPNYKDLLRLLAEIPGLSGVSNLAEADVKSLTSLMKVSTSNQDLGKLICIELKDCSRLRSLPDMVNLELLRVLDLSGCSELETIQGFPRNLKELYLGGTAVREVPQLPQSLELFNAHGCVSLKSVSLDFENIPVHYTLSNCFDLSPEVVNDFLVKALVNAKHLPRERQQELNRALAFSFCVPCHANQNSTLDLQLGSSVMTRLDPSWRNMLVGFVMLVEVSFSEDSFDTTGFGISCVCRWKNKEGHSHKIERNFHYWAPGEAIPKLQKDHMFVFCDVNMRPSTDEENDPDIWADLVVFDFVPVNKQTKPLDDICTVRRCGVRVITSTTGDTISENILPDFSSNTFESSGNDVEEEVLRVTYDGLQDREKALFLYMAFLLNDEDVGLVAPLIASIDLDVSSGLKVLADKSLICVSSNGQIVVHGLLRKMGKEILHGQSMMPGSSKKTERLLENRQSSVSIARKILITDSENSGKRTRDSFNYLPIRENDGRDREREDSHFVKRGRHRETETTMAEAKEEKREINKEEKSVKLFVGQIPKHMLESQLLTFFQEFAVVNEVKIIKEKSTGVSRGCCFLLCSSRQEADKLVNSCHNKKTLPGASNPVQVKYADGELERLEHKLFVGMLPKNVSEAEVQSLFSKYGTIKDLQILGGSQLTSRGCAFLKYETKEQADAAIEAVNGKHIMEGTVPLVVRWADTEKEKHTRKLQKANADRTNASLFGAFPMFTHEAIESYGHMLPPIQNQRAFPNMFVQPNQVNNNELQGTLLDSVPTLFAHRDSYVSPANYVGPFYPIRSLSSYPGYISPDIDNTCVSEGPEGANLFIYNIPLEFGDQELASIFQPIGVVLSAKVFVDKATGLSKCFGSVRYDSQAAAQNAVNTMNGRYVGGKKLRVQLQRDNDKPHQVYIRRKNREGGARVS